jgi:hypothetical protein
MPLERRILEENCKFARFERTVAEGISPSMEGKWYLVSVEVQNHGGLR